MTYISLDCVCDINYLHVVFHNELCCLNIMKQIQPKSPMELDAAFASFSFSVNVMC